VNIDWAMLAEIAVVAAAVALTVVLLVSFALVASSAQPGRRSHAPDAGPAPGTQPAGMVVAVLCVLAAGLIVCYGLYLIVA
jgi:hypothetical protein